MSKVSVVLALALIAGCASSPSKPEVSFADVAGEYHAYMEPGINPIELLDKIVMKTVRFTKLTIRPDGTYRSEIDSTDRPKEHGNVLDEGKIEIQGKSIAFITKTKLDPKKSSDQSFTVVEGMRLDPTSHNKYEYRFKNDHKLVVFKT